MSTEAKKEDKVVTGKEKASADAEPAPAGPELKMTSFLAPAAMMGMKYFKVDLSIYLDELRIAFGVVVVLKFLVIMYIYMLSQKSTDSNPVVVTEKGLDGKETTKKMTVKEYDASQVTKSAGQAAFALAITCGIHYKWGNPTPLFFQCFMGPMGMLDDQLFRIYILGNKAEGKLERPFKAPASPFQELMGGAPAEEPAKVKTDEGKKGKKDKKSD